MEKISCIYKITNPINSRIYIGSAVDFRLRRNRHVTQLNRKNHCNRKLQKFSDKYGVDKLSFEIIEVCEKEHLLKREQVYLDKYDCVKSGFNICPIAGSWLNTKHTSYAKNKMSLASIGTKVCVGRILSEETKDKIRQKAIGRKQSKKTIAKRVKKNTGKKRPLSAIITTREKVSKLNKEQVKKIRMLLSKGIYQYEIAKIFSVSQRVICMINNKLSYTHF